MTETLPESLTIPDSLRRNIRFFKHDAADAWLEGALEVAHTLASRWDISPESVLEGGAMSLCVLCRDGDGRASVLKIPSERAGGIAEFAALAAWNNGAVPRVMASDEVTGAFLMEFLPSVPGTPTPAGLAALLRRLHVAPDGLYPLETVLQARVGGAAKRFAGSPREIQTLASAADLIAALQATAEPAMVHGDFQAKNVLNGVDGPVAIDPLPAAGDPYSDLGLWIAGGSGGPRQAAFQDFAGLTAEPGRLLAWAWALTVVEYRPGGATAADAATFIAAHRGAVLAGLPVGALAA